MGWVSECRGSFVQDTQEGGGFLEKSLWRLVRGFTPVGCDRKANDQKITDYCRRSGCPNLVEWHALESKPGTQFGANHSLEPGLNICLQEASGGR